MRIDENTILSTARNLVRLSVFTALSYVLYLFVKFPLPGFPGFLELQISDVPALIAGFMMGPSYGAAVILIKCILKLPFSTTACVGELGDILIGLSIVLPASFVYKFRRSKKGALAGIGVGIFSSTLVAVVINRVLLIPFYMKLWFDGSWEPLLGMMSALFPNITVSSFYYYYLFLSVLPFNLLRGLLTGLITFLVYKSLEKLFDRLIPRKKTVPDGKIHDGNG